MFYVSYDKPKTISNKLLDNAVSFAANFLEIDGEIELYFDGEFNEGCCGYCEYDPEDEELTVYINPKHDRHDIITTFFHEMVHAKQYLKGELESGIGKQLSKWKGKEYDVPYFESPWEQEAYELEKVMFDIFNTMKGYTYGLASKKQTTQRAA